MERKQTHARTKSEEALLNKQLATITDTMVRVAKQRDEEVKKRELRAQQAAGLFPSLRDGQVSSGEKSMSSAILAELQDIDFSPAAVKNGGKEDRGDVKRTLANLDQSSPVPGKTADMVDLQQLRAELEGLDKITPKTRESPPNHPKDPKGKQRVQAGPSDLFSPAPRRPMSSSRTTAAHNDTHPSSNADTDDDDDIRALDLRLATLLSQHPPKPAPSPLDPDATDFSADLLPSPTHPFSLAAADTPARAHFLAQLKLDALIAATLAEEALYKAQQAARTVIMRRLAASAEEEDVRAVLGVWEREVLEVCFERERDAVRRTRTARVEMSTRGNARAVVRKMREVGGSVFGLVFGVELAVGEEEGLW